MSIFTIGCTTCMYRSVLLDFVWRCYDKFIFFVHRLFDFIFWQLMVTTILHGVKHQPELKYSDLTFNPLQECTRCVTKQFPFIWLETQNVFNMEWWLSFMYCVAVYNDRIIRMLYMISRMTCPCVRVLHNVGGHVPRLKSWKGDGVSFRVWNFPAVLGDKSLAAICVTLFTDVAGGTFQWLGGASKWILLRELEFCLTGTRLLVQRLPLRSHLTTLHILSSIPRSGPRSQFYANYLRHCAVLQRERVPHLGFVGFCRLL